MDITISYSYYSTNTYLFSLKRRQHRRRSFRQMRSNLAFIVPRPRRSFGQVVSDNKIRHSNKVIIYGRPFVSKLWHDILAVFSHVYLQSLLLHDIRAFFCHVYLRFIPKRAYICAQKSPYICGTNKHVVYGVTESRRIRGTELYRQQKNPSCTMEMKSNFSLNQAWPQWPR